MAQDSSTTSYSITTFIKILGKPIYYFIIGLISFAYFVVLLFRQIKSSSSNTKKILFTSHTSNTAIRSKSSPPTIVLQLITQLKTFVFRSSLLILQLFKEILTFITHLLRYPFSKLKQQKHRISSEKIAILKFDHNIGNKIPLRFTFHPLRFFFIVILLLSSYLIYQQVFQGLPHPKALLTYKPAVTSKIFDRHHQLLYQLYQDENRSIISLNQIPPHVILATLAIEDSEFYKHPGFSVRGIARAFKANLSHDSIQGGSTITQQLIKNTLLTNERTLTRKLRELVLAIAVESYFTKNEILEMYLNQVGYGGPAYGIEAASQMYFGKSVSDLTLSEAALLAGLPASPTTYSPFGTKPEYAIIRQKEVLNRMVQEQYISKDQANIALEKELAFASPSTNIKAPHFVMYVKDYLVNLYGETQVNQGGLHVTTSLDKDIQELAEVTINAELDSLRRLNINNAAAIVTNPKTGEILAMVGSQNFFDTKNDGQVNVVLRPRQPGSSIKPINYAYALEHGYTPNTIIDDSPVVYSVPGSPPYAPKNYDGRFHGRVTLRSALANSYNVPAVKTLSQFGVSNMVSLGKELGITTWNNPSRFGLALTLGGGEVTLADMSVAYGTFANGGLKVPLNPLISITDYTNKNYPIPSCPIPESQIAFTKKAQAQSVLPSCTPTQVISPATAFMLSDILSDNQARTPAFGSTSVLNIPGQQVAVKTGTTNNLRDNWTIGYTEDYVVGVWVGNNDNSPMSYVASGITGASPIWSKIMTALLEKNGPHSFTPPSDIVAVSVCPTTNTLNCSGCPNPKTEYFIRGTEPKYACSNGYFTNPEIPPSESSPRDQILTGITTQ
jgi:1A family penicillin-binding protein